MKKIIFLFATFSIFNFSNAQNIVFTDPEFKAMLLTSNSNNSIAYNLANVTVEIDSNNDGEIQLSEAENISKLNVGNDLITDYAGIEFFVNLKSLNIDNSDVTSIDLSNTIFLEYLNCSYTSLIILDLTNNTALKSLICSNSELDFLHISNNPNLQFLECDNNYLEALDITNDGALSSVKCNNNQLTSLDVSQNLSLITLECFNNSLSTLDISKNEDLSSLSCNSNGLTTLFLKNGGVITNLFFSGNPELEYICANEDQIDAINEKVTLYNYFDCEVNSYCSFVPGGFYFDVHGVNKLDSNNNGCDASDMAFSSLKYNISDGTNTKNVVANSTGNFDYAVKEGTYNITPVLENPTYFTVSPSTSTVTFPASSSPFEQNFCITPNGVHQDLEIHILPFTKALPGFEAQYKIVFKNKGTHPQSGAVNLAFDNAILSFVTANPTTTSQQANNINWNFNDLLPSETREISVTLLLNSQVSTPAVNAGDLLECTATITAATDETPQDNTSSLRQIVVNSLLASNYKICLDGATIAPSQVGKEVHYMIRFENNDFATAKNIVVKDMIDTTKFDINSLIPIGGSHLFETRISNTNQVEFIFENINLATTDANNDGFIAFKIKTKPNLVLGDTFSNTASIYFDYNLPIVTEAAETSVAALATSGFEFSQHFSISPNPATSVLNLKAKSSMEISSISIYNMLGQLVLVVPNANQVQSIDISQLRTGNYILKIMSDKGFSSSKFVKK